MAERKLVEGAIVEARVNIAPVAVEFPDTRVSKGTHGFIVSVTPFMRSSFTYYPRATLRYDVLFHNGVQRSLIGCNRIKAVRE